jgi:hypothetical protein
VSPFFSNLFDLKVTVTLGTEAPTLSVTNPNTLVNPTTGSDGDWIGTLSEMKVVKNNTPEANR